MDTQKTLKNTSYLAYKECEELGEYIQQRLTDIERIYLNGQKSISIINRSKDKPVMLVLNVDNLIVQ